MWKTNEDTIKTAAAAVTAVKREANSLINKNVNIHFNNNN